MANKPILTYNGTATPLFLHNFPKYLPTAYDESMTIIQKMNKVIRHLDEIGELASGLSTQWNEVMEWVMGDGLTVAVVARLNEWLEDGTLKQIINEEIFGDIQEKLRRISGLTEGVVNLYVDGATGVDEKDSGTESKPYKTIQYAVNQIPKIINHDRFIYVSDGIYDENISVKSINGAAIVIGRKGGIVNATDGSTGLKVRSIVFYDCNGLCRVNNFDQYNAGLISGEAFIRFSRCNYGTAHALRCADTSIKANAVEFDGTQGSVNSSYFNGQQYCVVSKNGSSVRVDSTNTHGAIASGTGILAQAGQVFLNGSNEWMDQTGNAMAQSQGGQIHRQIDVLDLTPYLKNGWKAYEGARNTPRAIRHNGVVHLQGIIMEGQVGQGIEAFTLPALWTPQFNDRVTNPFGSDGQRTKIVTFTSGIVAVEVSTGQYVSLSDIPPFYVGF